MCLGDRVTAWKRGAEVLYTMFLFRKKKQQRKSFFVTLGLLWHFWLYRVKLCCVDLHFHYLLNRTKSHLIQPAPVLFSLLPIPPTHGLIKSTTHTHQWISAFIVCTVAAAHFKQVALFMFSPFCLLFYMTQA